MGLEKAALFLMLASPAAANGETTQAPVVEAPARARPGAEPALADLLAAGGWQSDDEANAGLSQEAQGFRIYKRVGEGGAPEFFVSRAEPARPGEGRTFSGVRSVRGVGHHVVVTVQGYFLYYDLLRRSRLELGGADVPGGDFLGVAHILRGTLRSTRSPHDQRWAAMKDFEVLRDALTRYLGLSSQDVELAVSRIQSKANGGWYVVHSANSSGVIVEVEGLTYRVWPDFQAGSTDGPR